MKKDEIILIVESMGFHLDFDQWDVEHKQWMRFQLNDELDEPDLRLICFKNDTDVNFLKRAGNILFKAGQKSKVSQITQYIDLKK